jgi:hypothetical protein
MPRQPVLAPRAWEAAGEQIAHTRRRLAAIDPADRAAWSSVARESAGVLAAAAGRLQPGQRRELARASDALARAGELARGEQRGYRDPGLAVLSGVARVTTDALLASQGGSLATMMVMGQLAELAGEIARAHHAQARAAEALAAVEAAEQTLAYVHAASGTGGGYGPGNPETATLEVAAEQTGPAETSTVAPQRPGVGSGLGARPVRPQSQPDRDRDRGRG